MPYEKPTLPQYIGVDCRVCQTRLYGTFAQVGQELKCPDCGARTKLRAPPPQKPKKAPAALEGDQYELWDDDEPPAPAAAQPSYIALNCHLCDTLLYATADQVGQSVVCPDCGSRTVVRPPAVPKPRRSVMASDADTPRLDRSAAPGERPPVIIPPRRKMVYEEELDAEEARCAEAIKQGKKYVRRRDARGRAILPRAPLVAGVWSMLFTEEIIARWILISLVFGFAAQLLFEALLTPIQGMAEAIKLVFVVFGFVLAATWMALTGPLIVAIVGETADGEDKLNQAPRLLAFDWFQELFCAAMAGIIAGICGMGVWHLAQLAALPTIVSIVLVVVVVVLIFPITLLSTLLEATPLGAISPRVLGSLGRCAGPWFLFYCQTFLLAALVGAAAGVFTFFTRLDSGGLAMMAWTIGPLAMAALLIDMRLLGRLAWWISELTPEEEFDEDEVDA